MLAVNSQIGLIFTKERSGNTGDSSIYESEISELKSLADTLGWDIVLEFSQKFNKPCPRTYIGSGKVAAIQEKIKKTKITKILIGTDITPSQSRNLEQAFEVPVIDRCGLVLEIFEKHALTSQAKAQVELAKLKYQLPRLSGLWTHLDRERGGSNVSKGMGERQINIDRTLLRQRINTLSERLTNIAAQHKVQTKKRLSKLNVCLAGYTNTGKSSIMRALTNAEVVAKDQLFTTLESTTRLMPGKFRPDILISDSVGFIKDLPEDLIKAFRTTLAAILEADLVIHVCDPSANYWEEQLQNSEKIFADIGADIKPTLLVFNKMDAVAEDLKFYLQKNYPDSVLISSRSKKDIAKLQLRIEKIFKDNFVLQHLVIKQDDSACLSYLYQNGVIDQIKYLAELIEISVFMRKEDWSRFQKRFIATEKIN